MEFFFVLTVFIIVLAIIHPFPAPAPITMTTYWLYYGNEIVTAVRLPAGATDQEVKRHALEQHERVPLCEAFETPSTKANKIRHAQIIK